jgi:hypothetical protein
MVTGTSQVAFFHNFRKVDVWYKVVHRVGDNDSERHLQNVSGNGAVG